MCCVTCKDSNGAFDVVSVVVLIATRLPAKDEGRPGDEDDSGQGGDGEDAVQDGAFLLQEDPGQEGGKDWITEGRGVGRQKNHLQL